MTDDALRDRCIAVGKLVSKQLTGEEKRLRGGMGGKRAQTGGGTLYTKNYFEGGKVVIHFHPDTGEVLSVYGCFCREDGDDLTKKWEGQEAKDLWDSVS